MFNLGNFGGQLSIDELNGALRATGSGGLTAPPQTQLQMPAGNGGPSVGASVPPAVAQASDDEQPGGAGLSEVGKKSGMLDGVFNMKTIGSLVGSYFGPIGEAVGETAGGVAQAGIDQSAEEARRRRANPYGVG